jgi:hypothetical protein
MTISNKHKFNSAKADGPDATLVKPSNWNDEHDITLDTDRLIGRDTAGTGAAEEIQVTGGLEFTGAGGIRRSALTGDVTASAGSNTTTIANDAVTYAKMQNVSATDRLLGRSSAGAGDVEEIVCTAAGRALLDDASASAQRDTLQLGTSNTPQFTGIEVGNASDTTLTRSAAGILAVEGNNLARVLDVVGQQTIWVPAGALTPTTTNGAAASSTELVTNDVMLRYLAYDAATLEKAQILIQMPKSWDGGAVVVQFVWSQPAGSGNVVWGARGVAFANSDPMDTAFGTGQTTTSAGGTANDCFISSETAAITIAGSPGAEELVVFEFYRDAANGSDTLTVDAWLIGAKIHYTTNAARDD